MSTKFFSPVSGLLALLFLSILTVVIPVPAAAAVQEGPQPIQVFITADDEPDLDDDLIKTVGFAELKTWVNVGLSSHRDHHFSVSYQRTGTGAQTDPPFGCDARIYYSTDPATPPTRTGDDVAMLNSAEGCQGTFGAAAEASFAGTFEDVPDTVLQIWFYIEIWDAQDNPIACDYGWNRTSNQRQVVTSPNGCVNGDVNRGFKYLLESSRPTVEISTQIPPRFTNLVGHAAGTKPATGTGESLSVANNSTGPIQITIKDASTGGSGFNTKLNMSTFSISMGGKSQTANFTQTLLDGGYTLKLRYASLVAIAENTSLSFLITLRDFSGNDLLANPAPYIADKKTPSTSNGWALPATFRPGEVNITGYGGTARLNVTLADRTINGSASNTTAVRAYLYANTRGDATCTQQTPNKCLFISPVASLTMVRNTNGRNACAMTRGLDSACFDGMAQIRNISNSVPSYAAFNVNMSVTLVDSAQNVHTQNFTDVFRIQLGLPVIEPKVGVADYVKSGPNTVAANITDASPGVDSTTVMLRISNLTGDFPADPTGWRKIHHNIFEKAFDAREGNQFRWAIPDANDGTTISYQFRAQDQFGNLAFTADLNATDLEFVIDKKAPTIDEAFPRAFRAATPHNLTYAVVDPGYDGGLAGSQVNMSSGVLHFRVKGGTYTDVDMTSPSANLLSGDVEGTFAHLAVIEYWAEVQDVVGNLATNGTATAPKNYTVDLLKPTITMDDVPATTTTGDMTITTLATDEDSGIASITFEGRYQEASGTYSEWQPLQNSTSFAMGPMCLAAGVTYEFRAFAIDNAGNVADRSQTETTTVTAPGCSEEIVVSVSQPAPGSLIDAEGGSATKRIVYSAASTGTFTTSGFIRIQVDFSPDDGKHWITVARDQPNTGDYNWTVNAPTCDRCVIKIFATGPGGLTATGSSSNFGIINGNPTTDFDGNGMYDGCELRYFRAMGVQSPGDDADGDGLDNQDECTIGTDPSATDTDGDGASDGVESKLGSDPLVARDVPSETDKRYEQWGNYYFIIPVLFVAIMAVFLLGVARRW